MTSRTSSSRFALSSDVSNEGGAPETIGQLNDFQQAMILQAVMADKILPGATVAEQVTSMSNEWEAAEYLEQLRKCIEESRDGDRKDVPRKKATKTSKASKKTKKKTTTKKR
jgi:hypothetical protein